MDSSKQKNLLVAAIALQMEFVDRTQVSRVLEAWRLDQQKSVAALLEQNGVVSEATRLLLEDLAAHHLKMHGNSLPESLASLSAFSSIKQELIQAEDGDLQETLTQASDLRLSKTVAATQIDSAFEALLNQQTSERFRILRPHAEGGLGKVSVGEDRELKREVAVKSIKTRFKDDSLSRARFLVEAEVTGQLEHPGIVPVYGLGHMSGGEPFYVMRFIRGDSLKGAVRAFHSEDAKKRPATQRRLALRSLVGRLVDVCQAMEYAHSRGVLHRDLKPGNIMLGKYGETLVVDWGLAKTLGADATEAFEGDATYIPLSTEGSTETVMGSVVGTLAYMSPEQAEGRVNELGPAADVYCLGATLYNILSNRVPINESSPEATIKRIVEGDITPVKQVSEADSAIAAICSKAMATRPENRYRSAADLADDLELWLADEPVQAFREPLLKRTSRWLKRHETAAVATLTMSVVAALFFAATSSIVAGKNQELSTANQEIEAKSELLAKERDQLQQSRDELRNLAFNVLEVAEQKLASVPKAGEYRMELMERSFESFQKLSNADPSNISLLQDYVRCARLSANQLSRIGDSDEAIERLRLAIDLHEQIPEGSQESAHQYQLIELCRDRMNACRKSNNFEEAIAMANMANGLLGGIVATAEFTDRRSRAIGNLKLSETGVHDHMMDHLSGLQSATAACDRFDQLRRVGSPLALDAITLALAAAWEGRMQSLLGKHDEAKSTFAKRLAETTALVQEDTKSTNGRYVHSRMLHWSTEAAVRANQVSVETLQDSTEAVRLCSELHELKPSSTGFQANYADALRNHANIQQSLGKDGSLDTSRRAAEIIADLCKKNDTPDLKAVFAEILRDSATILEKTDGSEEEIGNLRNQALELATEASSGCPTSKKLRRLVDELRSL